MVEQLIEVDLDRAYHTALFFQKSRDISWERAMPLLKEELFNYIEENGGNRKTPYGFFISLKLPCGSVVNYKTFEDIPKVDTPCFCGNPLHWFVQYIDK